MEYKTIWVRQNLYPAMSADSGTVLECAGVTDVLNELAQEGWTLHSITPGTSEEPNAGTNAGLFVTVQR